MVEVFKTNIRDKITASKIITHLHELFPGARINFDLDDCDNVLRVENDNIIPAEVSETLKRNGFKCDVLE